MRDTQSISLDLIDVSNRLRAVDKDRALMLAANMATEGLLNPIEVRKHPKKEGRFVLIFGAHRVEAARLLEWEDIECVIRNVSADEARLREIDENLYRAELTELDRAVFLAEKKRLYEKLHPQAKHGGDRRSDQAAIFGDLVPRFSAEACERLGLSERSLQRTLARAALPADVRARIAGTPLANKGSDLDALLKMPADQRMPALDLLLGASEDAPRSLGEAVQRLSGNRPAGAAASVSKEDAQFDALLRAWKAAGAAARDRFVQFLDERSDDDA